MVGSSFSAPAALLKRRRLKENNEQTMKSMGKELVAGPTKVKYLPSCLC